MPNNICYKLFTNKKIVRSKIKNIFDFVKKHGITRFWNFELFALHRAVTSKSNIRHDRGIDGL